MMLHQDGSRHEWLEGSRRTTDRDARRCDEGDLFGFLVEEEGTASTFRGLQEVFAEHGLPISLCTDRGTHYFLTPKAAGRSTAATDPGRASPRASASSISGPFLPRRAAAPNGRSAHFRTVSQGAPARRHQRHPAATLHREIDQPEHNARFAVEPAEQEGTAFLPVPGVDLAEVLCIQEERQLELQHRVVLPYRLRLQIPPSPLRAHFVKATVKVRHLH